jgi:acetolactate synthase-1/2/3 large subunit
MQLLNTAEKPLLVIGYGANSCKDEMAQLVNHLGIPTVTTAQAKGIVSENFIMSLRHCGLAASNWIRKYIETKPDVVLVLGTDLDDCAVGITEFIGPDTKLIHVDLNPNVINRKYKATIGLVADIKDFANVLLLQPGIAWQYHLIANIKNTAPFAVPEFYNDNSEPITPHRALGDLERNTIDDTRFVTDIGEHMLFCLHYLTSDPDCFSIDLGLGSMGSGICQSIGMTLGDGRPTIVVCGDGGMQMHGMEILTAIRHNLPMIFAVFNDARYNMVYHGFKFSFGREEHLGQTDYIDFVKFAGALGIKGYVIDKPGQINKQLISEAFKSNRPVILDIRIDKSVRIAGAGRVEVLKHMGES